MCRFERALGSCYLVHTPQATLSCCQYFQPLERRTSKACINQRINSTSAFATSFSLLPAPAPSRPFFSPFLSRACFPPMMVMVMVTLVIQY